MLGAFVVLDDQRTQTDPERIAAMLGFLEASADQIQVVLTCHPGAYRGAGEGVNVVNLASGGPPVVIRRRRPMLQANEPRPETVSRAEAQTACFSEAEAFASEKHDRPMRAGRTADLASMRPR